MVLNLISHWWMGQQNVVSEFKLSVFYVKFKISILKLWKLAL